jgi:2'-hydroxyisoflavone reductase
LLESSVTTNRREFIKRSAVLGGAIGAGLALPSSLVAAFSEPLFIEPAAAPLRILILGGTGFIGPHQVRYAAARGHKITLFNRGQRNPGLFKGVANIEERIGDRAPKPGNYDSLKTGEWDVVIDNPTSIPRWVREASEALKGRVNQYVFISTISVYAANDTPGADETAAVLTTTTPDAEGTLPPNAAPNAVLNPNAVPGNLYGPLKALSEQEAEKHFPGRTTVIRPGLIVGIGDLTDRYTYWPVRVSRGGEVLAPPADDPVQFVDARDLSEWVIRCCENKVYGTFNVTGPSPDKFTVRQMVDGAKAALKSDATITYVTREFLQEQGVRGGLTGPVLPLWFPPSGGTGGFNQRSIAKAVSKGLTFRPYEDTVRATLEFYKSQPAERQAQLRQGISAEKEKEVLAAWHAKG